MGPSLQTLHDLAPGRLENHRSSRYRADEQAIELAAFAARDREVVIRLYAMLRELNGVVGAAGLEDTTFPGELVAFAERPDVRALVAEARAIGAGVETDARLAAAVHDIRGGALTAIFVQLARVVRGVRRPELARSLSLMARDHMKMMRNVAIDVDPPARERDLAFRPHSLAELARALREFTATVGGDPVVVEVTCAEDRVISESCVECSALDRVAYNLLNNAVTYTDRPLVQAWLLTLDADLRVVVANSVTEEQAERVARELERDRDALFGAFTTSGSGHGLRIVGELVGRAYGVASLEALVRGGYVGAKVAEGHFLGWFHWPLAGA